MQQLEFFEAIDKPTSVCPYCKKIFEKSKHNFHKKYCSNKCRLKIWRQKNKERMSGYRQKYKEKILESNKLYYQKNKEKILESNKLYHQKNKEKLLESKKLYRQKNKEKISQTVKLYNQKNKENILEYHKLYRQKNKEKISEYHKLYRQKNKEKFKQRYKEDAIKYRLQKRLRSRIHSSLIRQKAIKSKETLELLGCSWKKARDHLQSQFKEGMTWENHGKYGWHIDHIIPCASFDLKNLKQQKKCFHYTNLQPLWWHENLSKGKKILS